MNPARYRKQRAFTLVEVSLAMGVAAFCLLAMIGLLPMGINSNQATVQQMTAASLARTISADLRATPDVSGTATLSPVLKMVVPGVGTASSGTMESIYFASDGTAVSAVNAKANPAKETPAYRATVTFLPPQTGRAATQVRIFITWPGMADSNWAVPPAAFTGSYEVMTALDCN
ncbi:MAG TPA: prepilin-type N-terminal cleavage/methylation domain-containing protein [Chthoniobacteraceae bacterium]|jgi:uncharacterized protein (TIGR02598 family)|nr:prepilin-type N-terminal cleavage/methylation domain-containing protein [Chthoniobacteraceae bacterium]